MSKVRFGLTRVLLLLASAIALPGRGLATPVVGSFDIGGSSLTISPLSLGFGCNPSLSPPSCPMGSGNFTIASASGDFAPLASTGGLIDDLSTPAQPLNEPFSLPSFLEFAASPDLVLDLQFVFLGVAGPAQCAAAPAPGQTCTPAIPALVTASNPLGLAPFSFMNTQTGSTLSLSLAGVARRVSTGETSPFGGVLTAQFTVPYQSVLTQLATTGAVTTSYSMSFRAVPEPGTVLLVSCGLALLGGRRERERTAN